jgi:hypothetical protein
MHVPELTDYEEAGGVIRLRSMRQQALSEGNMGEREFQRVVDTVIGYRRTRNPV